MTNRQRGNELYVAGAAIIVIVLIVAAGAWYVEAQRTEAYAAGERAERLKWQTRESTELAAANAEILHLQGEVQARERQAAESIAALEQRYQQEVSNAQADHDRFIDDLAAGRVRFYVPRAPAGQAADRGAAPDTAAAARRGDGAARAELPRETAVALARLAGEADDVVRQLTLAQGVIEEDRKACR